MFQNVWYTYTTNAVNDPDGDQIRYHLNATGPGTPYQNTTIWVSSGTPMSWNLMWEPTDNPGAYLIQVWVEDSYGMLSHMASLSVTMVKPLCALKTLTDGYFYVPNLAPSILRIEMLFDNQNIVGDQTGGTSPYTSVRNWPDGYVNVKDSVLVGVAFGSVEGGANWNYMADIVPDRVINVKDTVAIGNNFGKSGTYITDLAGVAITFNTGQTISPDSAGFVTIPQGATSFTVKRNGNLIGAMVIFW